MNSNRSFLAAAPLFAAISLGQSAAPEASKQEAVPSYVVCPAGKIIGIDLRNDSEKNLGDIGDLLVETHSGEIRYAALDVGGFLGVGEDHRIVPWTLIQVIPDEKDVDKWHARTTLTEAQVKAAPKCKAKQRMDANLEKSMEASFGKREDWAYPGKDPVLAWCSQMDGALVKDPASKEVGTVKEVILAPANDCVAYAVVNTKKEAGDKLVALPWSRLGFTHDGEEKLVASTPVEIARFAAAPEYDRKDWKRMASTAWMKELSTYYECDPFWKTSRFATARKKPSQKP